MMKRVNVKNKQFIIANKQFGFIISALLIITTVISMHMQWQITPWLYFIALYFLTGSLWIPVLIKPFYLLFGKYLIKIPGKNDNLEILEK